MIHSEKSFLKLFIFHHQQSLHSWRHDVNPSCYLIALLQQDGHLSLGWSFQVLKPATVCCIFWLCCLTALQCHICSPLLHCPLPMSCHLQALLSHNTVPCQGHQNYMDLLTAQRCFGLCCLLLKRKAWSSEFYFFFPTDPHLEKMQMFPIWPTPPCSHWQMLSNVSAYFQPLLRCTDECYVCTSLVSNVFLNQATVTSKPIHNCCQPVGPALEWFLSLFIFVSVLNCCRSWAFISTSRKR